MNNMKDNLLDTFFQKALYSLGEASIKISENSFSKCYVGAVYEPTIPIELLKENFNK